VQIWYIGEPGIEQNIAQTLRGLSDPSVPVDVEIAQGIPVTLSLDVEIDDRFIEDDVLSEISTTLMDRDRGILAPEHIGIGRPLFRSRIFETVLSVPGALAIRGISRDGAPFAAFAMSPGAGKYFDLAKGALILNGREDILD
jgi:hypothetical protein